jgi:LPS export ABC transporter protein LptC
MKSFLKRQWPLIGLGALLVIVSFYLIKSSKESVQETIAKEVSSEEGLKLKDVHYTQDDPEKGLKWVVDAKEVKFSGDKSFVSFYDFRLKVEPKGRPSFELQGKRGNYSRDTGQLDLWGDLKGLSGDGYQLVTDGVHIDEKKGQMTTDKPVKISGPFFSVTGKGLFVDLEDRIMRVLSDVTTTVDEETLIK